MFDLLKNSPVCIDLGCGSGHISHHLSGGNIHCLIQCDMSEEMVKRNSKTAADTEAYISIIFFSYFNFQSL
jgi:methylase of polypeptide subunit release factors